MGPSVTELRCPSCGAPDRTIADAQGMRTCPFCGARYHVNAAPVPMQHAAPIPVSAFASPRFIQPQRSQGPFVAGVIIASVVAVMVIGGTVAGLLLRTAPRTSSPRATSFTPPSHATTTFTATGGDTDVKAT
ncbi:MAG: hypothetical protein ABIP89_18685, partial [Polyangiaceae bacterium]